LGRIDLVAAHIAVLAVVVRELCEVVYPVWDDPPKPRTLKAESIVLAFVVSIVGSAINIGLTARVTGRTDTGVSGPAQRRWSQPWKVIALAAWLTAYFAMAPHYHPGVSHLVWGLYPASAPLLIIGLATTAVTAAFRYWPMAGAGLAIAVTAAAAGFGGPAGAWLIMGIGLCATYLGIGALKTWRQRLRTERR
jgi:hypothetical protein